MRTLTAALVALAMLVAVPASHATTTHKKKHHQSSGTQTSKSKTKHTTAPKDSGKGAAPATK